MNSHEGRRDYICEKCHKAFLTKYHLTRHLKICKGPKTDRGHSQDEEEEGEEDEEEEEEEEENASGGEGGVERLLDSTRSEDCALEVTGYNSEKSLSPHH